MKDVIMMGADSYEHLTELVQKDRAHMGVGKNCHIEHAILDKNCRIGDNVTIQGGEGLEKVETESYCIIDGIVVVKKGAIIPSGSKIGLVS